MTVYKENRLVFKHEKSKVIAANNEQISNIIADKYGKKLEHEDDVKQDWVQMMKLGLSKAQKKTIRFAGKDRKKQLFQYYEDLKGQELDELHYKKTQERCDEKAPHEMEDELSALRSAKSPLANVE